MGWDEYDSTVCVWVYQKFSVHDKTIQSVEPSGGTFAILSLASIEAEKLIRPSAINTVSKLAI